MAVTIADINKLRKMTGAGIMDCKKALVETNNDIDFVIPANDDASKSIELILDTVCAAMQEGLEERKVEKVDNKDEEATEEATQKPKRARVGRKAAAAAAPAAEEAPATEAEAE